MLSPETLSACSNEELEAEIRAILPEGRTLTIEPRVEGYWSVLVGLPGESPEVEESHIDLKIALLSVLGELGSSKEDPGSVSPWARRRELSRELVTKQVSIAGSKVPDPPDLDPSEIDSLYRSRKS